MTKNPITNQYRLRRSKYLTDAEFRLAGFAAISRSDKRVINSRICFGFAQCHLQADQAVDLMPEKAADHHHELADISICHAHRR